MLSMDKLETMYIHLWRDDADEDMGKFYSEVDMFLENMKELPPVIKKMTEAP